MVKQLRVLMVGTSAKGASFLLQCLEKRGCECHMAISSAEAALLFSKRGFDLVLCTGWMRGMNGLIATLIGSRASLFCSHPVEDSCLWLPVVRDGEKCLGAPALRPGEFARAVYGILGQVNSDTCGSREATTMART